MTGGGVVLRRELAVTLGSPALPVAMGVHAALLMVFLLVWGGGVPTMQAATVLEQARVLQWGTLVVVMPWAAARSIGAGGREGIRLLSLLTGVPSRRIVGARLAAVFVLLVWVGLAGLPFLVLAQQISAAPSSRVSASVTAVFGLAAIVTPVVTRWALDAGERLTIWIGTALTTAVVVWLATRLLPVGTPWALAALGIAAAGLLLLTGQPSTRGDMAGQ